MQTFEDVMGEDMEIFGFEMKNGSDLWIQDNPKVKQVTPLHHIEGYGYVSMFSDIDGNYFQLVQVRAN